MTSSRQLVDKVCISFVILCKRGKGIDILSSIAK